MSRVQNMQRIGTWKVRTKDWNYIHYYFLNRDIREALQNFARGNFLDLGCGNKPYREWYSVLTETQIGCDIAQSNKNCVDVICPVTELEFESNQFDSILCTQVLEHVFDHDKMMSEAYRVLKPGGHLILTVPFAWELHEEPYDFFRYTKHALKQLFENSGFKLDYIKANGGKWAALYQLRNNMLYDSFNKHKTFANKLKKIWFVEFRMMKFRNLFAIWLDKNYPDDVFTQNYIVVAHKPL